ncbi:MAG: PIG-L deacetylase family protein [Candidatus Saccharimonadales bacterium]|jgi:LmbE family N-acetylglucosaminyl deacetylase
MFSVQELFHEYESYKSDEAGNGAEVTAAAVLAHPDDEMVISNLIAAAKTRRIKLLGITLTRGEASTKNHRAHDPEFALQQGSRAHEAREGALLAGFVDHFQQEGTDGNLESDVPWLINDVAELLVAHEVDIVFGISQMKPHDSYDHESAGKVGLGAASLAAQSLGHVGMLTVQPDGRGQWTAESSAASLDVVRKIACANDSQFRVGQVEDRPTDWYEFTPGFSMHPEDWSELDQLYPINGIATHSYAQYGRLLVPQLVEI